MQPAGQTVSLSVSSNVLSSLCLLDPGAAALGHTGQVEAHAVVHVLLPGQHRALKARIPVLFKGEQ